MYLIMIILAFSLTSFLNTHLMHSMIITISLKGNLYKIGGIMLLYDKLTKTSVTYLKET